MSVEGTNANVWRRVGELAHGTKVLSSKHGNLSSIPGTHVVEEKILQTCPLTYSTAGTLLHTHALINDCKDGGDHKRLRFLRLLGFDRLAQASLGEHV